jgi:hypothetical protein
MMLLEDRTGCGEHHAASGGEEAVVPHLGEAAREHVLRTAPAGACRRSSVHEARSWRSPFQATGRTRRPVRRGGSPSYAAQPSFRDRPEQPHPPQAD